MKYSYQQLSEAISDLSAYTEGRIPDEQLKKLFEEHPCIDEINQFGPYSWMRVTPSSGSAINHLGEKQ